MENTPVNAGLKPLLQALPLITLLLTGIGFVWKRESDLQDQGRRIEVLEKMVEQNTQARIDFTTRLTVLEMRIEQVSDRQRPSHR